jgi:ribonuclease BN (tRNA processing enzyme)
LFGLLHLLRSPPGTNRRFAAARQVVGYWKCCGRSARVLSTAALDPEPDLTANFEKSYFGRAHEAAMKKIWTFLVASFALFLVGATEHESVAQTNTALPKAETRLITLGTVAGPPPRPHRAQFSNLLIVNGTIYVIDAGDGVARRIAKAGFNVRDVGIVFITHHHDDHTAGLGTLMSAAWDNQRTKPINVYGPPRTEELVKAAVQYFTISADIRIADGGRTIPIEQLFFGHDVGSGVIYKDGNVKVTAIENTHFGFHKGAAAGKHKSYSYRFETPSRVIVFTSDTGPFAGLVEFAKGADLLVAEANSIEQRMQDLIRSGQWQVMTNEEQARIKRQMSEGHLSPDDVGQLAKGAAVKSVVLSHLTWKADDDYSSWVDEVKKHFSGPVLIAKDLKEF